MTHGARALLPNGFRFRFMPRKVPGLSAHWLRRREGGGEPEARAMAPHKAAGKGRGGGALVFGWKFPTFKYLDSHSFLYISSRG